MYFYLLFSLHSYNVNFTFPSNKAYNLFAYLFDYSVLKVFCNFFHLININGVNLRFAVFGLSFCREFCCFAHGIRTSEILIYTFRTQYYQFYFLLNHNWVSVLCFKCWRTMSLLCLFCHSAQIEFTLIKKKPTFYCNNKKYKL